MEVLIAGTFDTIDFLILSSPFLKAPTNAKWFKFIPYKICGFIKLQKTHSESKTMLEYSKNDPLACSHFTLRLVGNIFVDGVNYATNRFKKIKLPLLIMGGKLDPIVNSNDFDSIFNNFGSTDKTLKIYDNIRHRVVQNDYKDEIIADIINWIMQKERS